MWFPAHTSALEPLRDRPLTAAAAGEFAEAPVQFIGSATAQVVPAGHRFRRLLVPQPAQHRALRSRPSRGPRSSVRAHVRRTLGPSGAAVRHGRSARRGPAEPPLIVGSGRRDEPLVEPLVRQHRGGRGGRSRLPLGGPGRPARPPLRDFPFAPMRDSTSGPTPEPLPPVPGLTVSTEQWEQRAEPAAAGRRRVAVLDLAGPDSALAARCALRLPVMTPQHWPIRREADLVLVVAPVLDHLDAEVAAQRDRPPDRRRTARLRRRRRPGVPRRLARHRRRRAGAAGRTRTAAGAGRAGGDAPQHRVRTPRPGLPPPRPAAWEIDDATATAVVDALRAMSAT